MLHAQKRKHATNSLLASPSLQRKLKYAANIYRSESETDRRESCHGLHFDCATGNPDLTQRLETNVSSICTTKEGTCRMNVGGMPLHSCNVSLAELAAHGWAQLTHNTCAYVRLLHLDKIELVASTLDAALETRRPILLSFVQPMSHIWGQV